MISPTRREFLHTAAAAGALALTPRFALAAAAPATTPSIDRKIRLGIVGGRFGATFQFHEHPHCTVAAVSDLRADRRAALMKTYRCSQSYDSLAELLRDPQIEAVFLATPAPDHVTHVIAALKAGKHVLCAVPAALTLDECATLREAVRTSGLTYMMAETSYWQQATISARKFYQRGNSARSTPPNPCITTPASRRSGSKTGNPPGATASRR